MYKETQSFISRMKLQELKNQQDKLLAVYNKLSEDVSASKDEREQIRKLHSGLRKITFANRSLHPEVSNLDILLYEIENGTPPERFIGFWQKKLEKELELGRRRANFGFLYGSLLDEWTKKGEVGTKTTDSNQIHKELIKELIKPEKETSHEKIFDAVLKDFKNVLGETARQIHKAGDELRKGSKLLDSLKSVLENLKRDIFRPAWFRVQVDRLLSDDKMVKEFSDALTILIDKLDSWEWDSNGLESRIVWTRNKWRLYFNIDLPTTCLLKYIGEFWSKKFENLLLRKKRRSSPLHIINNSGVWPSEGDSSRKYTKRYSEYDESLPIQDARFVMKLGITLSVHGEYERDYSKFVWPALRMIQGEIKLARTAFPDMPLHVLKVDLKDFYPSIEHRVILDLLSHLGMSKKDVDFIEKMLSPPLKFDEGVSRAKRGLPVGYRISRLLGELLMRVLDHYIAKSANVRIIRLVDDICLLSPSASEVIKAWKAVNIFCEACGLKVNEEKSGAVSIGDKRPVELPHNKPRWMFLELNDKGEWTVNQETVESHLEQSRERVKIAPALLTQVALYNADLKYLIRRLALEIPLGDSHRKAVGETLAKFHNDFFEKGKGMGTYLQEEITKRFLGSEPGSKFIPEACFYWPITAGGMGLLNPFIAAVTYQNTYEKYKTKPVPENRSEKWDIESNEWSDYYKSLIASINPLEPENSKFMQALIKDFVQRGNELVGKTRSYYSWEDASKDLKPYWRWILYTYGAQILEEFGTFRFLITELVPLQLITYYRIRANSLAEKHNL